MLTKDIKTALTDEEKASMGMEIAEHACRVEALEDEKRKVTSGLRIKINDESKAFRAKSKALREGHIWKSVEVELEHDFARNTVLTKRKDTGEIVGERAMTVDERQKELAFGDAGDAAENDAPVIEVPDDAPKKRKSKKKTDGDGAH
jgi:hypothetical protein